MFVPRESRLTAGAPKISINVGKKVPPPPPPGPVPAHVINAARAAAGAGGTKPAAQVPFLPRTLSIPLPVEAPKPAPRKPATSIAEAIAETLAKYSNALCNSLFPPPLSVDQETDALLCLHFSF